MLLSISPWKTRSSMIKQLGNCSARNPNVPIWIPPKSNGQFDALPSGVH